MYKIFVFNPFRTEEMKKWKKNFKIFRTTVKGRLDDRLDCFEIWLFENQFPDEPPSGPFVRKVLTISPCCRKFGSWWHADAILADGPGDEVSYYVSETWKNNTVVLKVLKSLKIIKYWIQRIAWQMIPGEKDFIL